MSEIATRYPAVGDMVYGGEAGGPHPIIAVTQWGSLVYELPHGSTVDILCETVVWRGDAWYRDLSRYRDL